MTPTVTPTLTFHCPHCNATLEASPTSADEVALCPSCHQTFNLELPRSNHEAAPALLLPRGVEPPPVAPPVAAPLPPAPAAAAPAPVSAPAPAASTPAVAAPLVEQPESAGELIHVSMVRRYPGRCLAYFVVTVACIAGIVWSLDQNYTVVAMIVGAVLAFVAFRFGTWWLRMHQTTLTITDRRCIIETGLFTREAAEIGRKDVIDVHVSQNPIMRLLNVGDLVIRSEAGTRKEIVLMAVPDPDNVVKKISPLPPPPAAQPAAPETTSAA
jgi:membrane protein YdbS with pleckstrin-like domain